MHSIIHSPSASPRVPCLPNLECVLCVFNASLKWKVVRQASNVKGGTGEKRNPFAHCIGWKRVQRYITCFEVTRLKNAHNLCCWRWEVHSISKLSDQWLCPRINLSSVEICRALTWHFHSIFNPALKLVVTALTCDHQSSELFQVMISVVS